MNLDYESWRCTHDEKKFCPPEGCTLADGCARDKGGVDTDQVIASKTVGGES